jgi:hypothetical protein
VAAPPTERKPTHEHERTTGRPPLAEPQRPDAPNHHLWNNHGTWWIHYTVPHGPTKEPVRQSLATRCLNEARRKRDALFEAFFLAGRCAT